MKRSDSPTDTGNGRSFAFALRGPDDLLGKLRFDEKRLRHNPSDSYAAFDFFVTASHMPDWLEAADKITKAEKRELREQSLIKVCSHLGDGSKHFHLDNPRHDSVRNTEHAGGIFDSSVFQADAFQAEKLVVHLEEERAKELRLGNSVDAVTLAAMILSFWEEKLLALKQHSPRKTGD